MEKWNLFGVAIPTPPQNSILLMVQFHYFLLRSSLQRITMVESTEFLVAHTMQGHVSYFTCDNVAFDFRELTQFVQWMFTPISKVNFVIQPPENCTHAVSAVNKAVKWPHRTRTLHWTVMKSKKSSAWGAMLYSRLPTNALTLIVNPKESPFQDSPVKYVTSTMTPQKRQFITALSAMFVDLDKDLGLTIAIACVVMLVYLWLMSIIAFLKGCKEIALYVTNLCLRAQNLCVGWNAAMVSLGLDVFELSHDQSLTIPCMHIFSI